MNLACIHSKAKALEQVTLHHCKHLNQNQWRRWGSFKISQCFKFISVSCIAGKCIAIKQSLSFTALTHLILFVKWALWHYFLVRSLSLVSCTVRRAQPSKWRCFNVRCTQDNLNPQDNPVTTDLVTWYICICYIRSSLLQNNIRQRQCDLGENPLLWPGVVQTYFSEGWMRSLKKKQKQQLHMEQHLVEWHVWKKFERNIFRWSTSVFNLHLMCIVMIGNKSTDNSAVLNFSLNCNVVTSSFPCFSTSEQHRGAVVSTVASQKESSGFAFSHYVACVSLCTAYVMVGYYHHHQCAELMGSWVLTTLHYS